MQTSGIEQIRADVWVAPHGLHCLSLYTVRLFGCSCLLEVWQWDGANLHQFTYSNCMTFFQPWCKPVVLDMQCWYLGCSTWVALAQFRTTCILAGCLVEIACLEKKLWDGANLHSFPYSNCVNFFQPSCKPVLLNNYVLMFGLHHMGCIVTVWIAVGCFVVFACLKYSSEMVWTSIITRIPPAWLSSNLLQPNGIGQTSVYVWVGPHGLHCRNLIHFAYWQVVWL